MSTTIVVAPREIHDLVYRASRIAGCDAGTAERIAESVTLAEIGYTSAITALCYALTPANSPTSAKSPTPANSPTSAKSPTPANSPTSDDLPSFAELPASVWVTAPDRLLEAEVALRSGGDGRVEFESGVALAALVGTLWQCLERGIRANGFDDTDRGDSIVYKLELRECAEEAAAIRESLATAVEGAHCVGVAIDKQNFRRLEEFAAGFLVAESTLDHISDNS